MDEWRRLSLQFGDDVGMDKPSRLRAFGGIGQVTKRGREPRRDGRSRGSIVKDAIHWLGFALVATGWGGAVWIWPGLRLGGDVVGLGLQPDVLIAAASIEAAVVLFALAVGAVVLQVLGQYSWSVVRSVLSSWFAPVLLGVVGGGVVFPLWVAFSPSLRLSTAAFAAFGWSILAVGSLVWVAAQRINPPSLSARARRRALVTVSRGRLSRSALDDVAEVLGQLVAGAVLPYAEGQRLVGGYSIVLAARTRDGVNPAQIVASVKALGERASGAGSAGLAQSIVKALWILGLDQWSNTEVADEIRSALTAIASNARGQGLGGC